MASTSGYLRTIRYSSPFIIVTCAALLSAAAACITPPSKRNTLSTSSRIISKRFTVVICACHLLAGLLQALCAVIEVHWVTDPDAVVYTILSFLLWLVISIIQSDAKQLYWLPNLATWALALLFDTTICLLSFQSAQAGSSELVQLSIALPRIASLVFLCISIFASPTTPMVRDFERVPLLRPSYAHQAAHSNEGLENDKHGENTPNGITTTCEQEKHVEKIGGWWAYLYEVKFLLPYIFPFKDRSRQLYALIMLVLMLCGRICQLFGPRLLGNIVQAISNNHTDSTLSRQILIYVFVVKLPYEVVLEPARKWLSVRLFYGSYLDLLLSLASHVADLSYAFHENKQTGEIIAAIGQGQVINQFVDDFVESTLPLVLDIVAALAYITYLFDVYVALILASTYVFYGIVTYKGTIMCAAARRRYREMSRVEGNVLHESIANWMSTFYLNRQDYQHNRLHTLSRQELRAQEYNYDITMIMRTCQTLVISLGYLGILLRTAHLTTHTEDAVGNFVALLFYWAFFTNPLFKLAHFYHSLVQALVDVERLRQLMQTKPTVFDAQGAQNLFYREGKVEYRDVSFSYDGKNPVITNLSFIIEPGSTVAFVGQSGSGKTTTCDKLLFRAYEVTEGAILIDDQDIRGVAQTSLRETVGIVRQEPAFNNDTVLENVRYAHLDASNAEIVAACKDAAIHEQIMRFPMGYHTIVGERGIKLSAGERQRLAIAQLILRNPKIVVLDEATSNVDNVIESEIQESFARLRRGRTTIIIAHRLSTVQHADQIFVLDKGTIVERGSHDELLVKHGKYFQLWDKTQTKKRLTRDLMRVESEAAKEQDDKNDIVFSRDSEDADDSDHPTDIMQLDGASSSKQADDKRTGMRRRIRDLREMFSSSKDGGKFDECINDDGEDEDMSPIRVMSPRATETSPPPPFSRRSSRSHRRSSRVRKPRNTSSLASPNKVQTRSISAPMSPIRVQTQEIWPLHDPVGPDQPDHEQAQELSSPVTQEPLTFRNMPSRSRIPVSVSPLSTPVRTRQSTAREILLQSPQSPGRNAALRSHPILRGDEEGDGSGTTYHTPETSVGNSKGC